MSSSIPALLSDRMAAAMSHPTRLYAMTVLFERDATPGEIADGLGLEINRAMHHIRRLRELDCIELVEERPAAGGRVSEQVYRARFNAFVDGDAWARLTPLQRISVTISILRLISEDLQVSLATGAFFDPDDNHISRNPMKLDEAGWKEVVSYLDDVTEGLGDIQRRVDARLQESDEGGEIMFTKIEILQFRSPSQDRYPHPGKGHGPGGGGFGFSPRFLEEQ